MSTESLISGKKYVVLSEYPDTDPAKASYAPSFGQFLMKTGVLGKGNDAAWRLLSYIQFMTVGRTMRIHESHRHKLCNKRISADLGMHVDTVRTAFKKLFKLKMIGGKLNACRHHGHEIYLTYDIDHFYTDECPEGIDLYYYYREELIKMGVEFITEDELNDLENRKEVPNIPVDNLLINVDNYTYDVNNFSGVGLTGSKVGNNRVYIAENFDPLSIDNSSININNSNRASP